jgi:hypothetical protein
LVEVEAMTKHQYDDDFNKFYEAFPRKTGKFDAFKAWKKALASGVAKEDLMAALALHKRLRQWNKPGPSGEPFGYVPHASSWLNGRRWEDEPSPSELIPTRKDVLRKQTDDFYESKRRTEENNRRFEAELAAKGLSLGDYLRQVREEKFGSRRRDEEIEVPFDEKGEGGI